MIRQAFASVCQIAQVGMFALLAGCTPPAQVVRTQTVEVPKYIREPLPIALISPITVVEPTPACTLGGKPALCNGQLATLLGDYRDALNECNADKAALRALDAKQP